MLIAPSPRAAWSFGLPQDLAFTWSNPEAPSGFAPPTPASAAPRPLLSVEVALLAPLPPAGLEALPPTQPAASTTPLPQAPPPPPQPILEPPPSLSPEPSLPDLSVALPAPQDWALPLEPPFPPITPPSPAPLAADPAALLDALWAARPPLPEIPWPGLMPPGLVPPAPPPPHLAWPML